MSKPKINEFTQFEMDPDQEFAGQLLTQQNIEVIQNLRATASLEKLALKIDPNNFNVYLQQEASLSGQIDILTHILDAHDAAYNFMSQRAEDEADQTSQGEDDKYSTNRDTSNIFQPPESPQQ